MKISTFLGLCCVALLVGLPVAIFSSHQATDPMTPLGVWIALGAITDMGVLISAVMEHESPNIYE